MEKSQTSPQGQSLGHFDVVNQAQSVRKKIDLHSQPTLRHRIHIIAIAFDESTRSVRMEEEQPVEAMPLGDPVEVQAAAEVAPPGPAPPESKSEADMEAPVAPAAVAEGEQSSSEVAMDQLPRVTAHQRCNP